MTTSSSLSAVPAARALPASSTSSSTAATSPCTRAVAITRVLFGIVFVGSGIMGFVGATPPSTSAASAAFVGALAATGYFIPLLSGVQLVAGALLVAGRAVPLAIAALAPVVVHIVAFRIFLTPVRLVPIGLVLLAAELALAWAYRSAFAPLFRPAA